MPHKMILIIQVILNHTCWEDILIALEEELSLSQIKECIMSYFCEGQVDQKFDSDGY